MLIEPPDLGVLALEPLEDDLLVLRRHLGQGVGGGLGQLPPLIAGQPGGLQVVPNHLEPGQLRGGHLAGLGHVVPHPAGEVVALLLELVEQLLHPLGLPGQLRGGQLPGVAVGIDELQLLQGLRALPPLPDAGDAPPSGVLPGQQLQGRPPAVAGDHHHMPARSGAHPDGLLQAAQLDVGRQLLQALQGVKIVGVRVNALQVYVLNLFPPGVRIGHRCLGDKLPQVNLAHKGSPPLPAARPPRPGSPGRRSTRGSRPGRPAPPSRSLAPCRCGG